MVSIVCAVIGQQSNLATLHGTTVGGDKYEHFTIAIHRMEKLTYNICYYTGVCVKNEWTEHQPLDANYLYVIFNQYYP